ncbi:hypothetical protein NC651_023321 [Populus alba x Populus x berolinensis]|nr:hypothetical protein NC651_023321 [Populus alba x Populus x berolinensis]
MRLQEGQMSVLDRNCNSGLHCETCVANGNLRPRCTGIQPLIPTSKNGIRGLTLDMYDFQNDIWLSHSFGENCYNIAAFCCGKRWPNFIAVDFYKSVHFTLSFPNMTFGACNLTYLSTYCRFKLCKPTGGIFLLVADLNSVPVFFGCTNYRKDMPF